MGVSAEVGQVVEGSLKEARLGKLRDRVVASHPPIAISSSDSFLPFGCMSRRDK